MALLQQFLESSGHCKCLWEGGGVATSHRYWGQKGFDLFGEALWLFRASGEPVASSAGFSTPPNCCKQHKKKATSGFHCKTRSAFFGGLQHFRGVGRPADGITGSLYPLESHNDSQVRKKNTRSQEAEWMTITSSTN